MSVREVIATIRDCLKDDVVGLAPAVRALAGMADKPERVRDDFNFVKWKLSGAANLQPTTAPNVMLRPKSWSSDVKQATHRNGKSFIELGIEWFDAETDVLQDNITIGAVALARVVDGLRAYSDAHDGTIIDVVDPIQFVFGEFDAPASSGFLATLEIEERSVHE
jgi:hypothetical protein